MPTLSRAGYAGTESRVEHVGNAREVVVNGEGHDGQVRSLVRARNDICDKHEDYLRSHGGSRALGPDSDHHAIRTERVAQWLGRWDQLGVLPPGQA